MPEPVPDPVTVTHDALVDDVHAQPDCVVTVIVPDVPVGTAVISDGVIENVQVALGSVIVNDCPAMVSVADRANVPVLDPAT